MVFEKGLVPHNKGKKMSESMKNTIRNSVLKKYNEDHTYRKRVSKATKKAMQNPKIREKMSIAGKKLWADSDWRKRWSKSASEKRSGEKHWNYKGGISEYVGFHKSRKIIREKRGGKCQICNTTDKRRQYVVHHIDFDSRNQKLDNLLCCCRSCHSKIHDVGKNKGKKGVSCYKNQLGI